MIRVNEWYGIDVDACEFQLLRREPGESTDDMTEISRHKTLKGACDACFMEMLTDLFFDSDTMGMREAISKINVLKSSISDLFLLAESESYE